MPPSAALSPEELQYPWLGEVVEAPGLPVGRDRSFLEIGPSTVELNIDQPEFLLSDITAGDPGVLRLVARNSTGDCSPGDVGLYAWTLSPKGTQLQLTASEDACTARRAAFEGAWERSACRNPDNSCLGDLEAGTYKSQFIGPRLDEGEPWTANYGAFSYTVPDGWSNTSDFPDNYTLMRSADYAVASDPKDGTKDLVEFYARPGIALQDQTCEPQVKPETGRSVDELIAYVTQHPGLTASIPQPITIDGHAGQMVDVSIAPSWTGRCPEVPDRILMLFTETGPDMTGSGLEQPGLWRTDKMRIVLLDLGDGDVMLIDLLARDPANFDEADDRGDADRRVVDVQVVPVSVRVAAPVPGAASRLADGLIRILGQDSIAFEKPPVDRTHGEVCLCDRRRYLLTRQRHHRRQHRPVTGPDEQKRDR